MTLDTASGESLNAPGPSGDPLAELINHIVVLDTQGILMYIGTLMAIHPHWLELRQVDVHNRQDSRTTNELYLVETRSLGVRVNRERVWVKRDEVASISLLADVHDN